jgi:dienelactone hydrolase
MALVTNTIHYVDKDTRLEGFFAYDNSSSERLPAVLISHAWGGRDDFVMQKAEQLAEMGYFAFALDMYGEGKTGSTEQEKIALMQPFMDDRAILQQRINAALYAVTSLPWVNDQQIAAIGFCFGGLCVLDLARSGANIKGVVSFHGLLNKPDFVTDNTISAKVLALHGYDDPMNPPTILTEFFDEMTHLKVDWQLHNYGNTQHAFSNPLANDPKLGLIYNSVAEQRAWLSMQNFLSEIFSH